MVILGCERFLMSEVPLYPTQALFRVQGFVICIHLGRAHYKVLDMPVLILDAPPDVTFFRNYASTPGPSNLN